MVYYMLESRSFDNVMGWLYRKGQQDGLNWIGPATDGFRGLDASMSNPLPDGQRAFVSQYMGGTLSNEFILGGPAQDPWHDNSDVLMQMFHGYKGYTERKPPTMDGFAWNQNSAAVLSSFTPQQLTVLNGLAREFAVSDDWFSSVPGGTDLNRGFSVSGSAYNRLGTWEGARITRTGLIRRTARHCGKPSGATATRSGKSITASSGRRPCSPISSSSKARFRRWMPPGPRPCWMPGPMEACPHHAGLRRSNNSTRM